ncbi:uncharacterized protein SPAPADRAFT_60201, partial [Spathaspora passalidarum NRRL Y-27907]
MILVNRNTSASTNTTTMDGPTTKITNSNPQTPVSSDNHNTTTTTTANDHDKKPKFNISTFFKKIPNINIASSI